MKQHDITALRDKTIDELRAQLTELEVSRAKARLEKAANKLDNTRLVSRLGDDIARIKTIMTEKQQVAATPEKEVVSAEA